MIFMRRLLNSVLSLSLMLSVSVAGYGFAAGANHCWMMAVHGHHMQAAAEHCATAGHMGMDYGEHAGMAAPDPEKPVTQISAEMSNCRCCVGPVTSSLSHTANSSLAGAIAVIHFRVSGYQAPSTASVELYSSGQRAPPSTLLSID